MGRAAIFIGVDRANGLEPLHDAAAGAERLCQRWKSGGQFDRLELLTDAGGKKVTLDRVFETVADVLKRGDVEQLFVYFAGHGINVARHECWLLSDAPKMGHAVISATVSEEQARYCGVPHVVFISDACRTAAGSIGLQNVTGNGIFANEEPSGNEKPVDLFFGASLGRPAYEVSNDVDAASGFRALYTDELVKAFDFDVPRIIEWTRKNDTDVGLIRPRTLRDYLGKQVSRTIRDRKLSRDVVQVPDARITSDPHVWLARRVGRPPPPVAAAEGVTAAVRDRPRFGSGLVNPFDDGVLATTRRSGVNDGRPARGGLDHDGLKGTRPFDDDLSEHTLPSVDDGFERMGSSDDDGFAFTRPSRDDGVVRTRPSAGDEVVARAPDLRASSDSLVSLALRQPGFVADLLSVTDAAGPRQFESQCGLKLRGLRVREAFALGAGVQQLGEVRDIVRVNPQHTAPVVLLVLDNGTGVVVPAIPGFIGALTFDGGEFIDLAYEPSANTARGTDYPQRARELQTLRKVVATASRNGAFRLEGDDAALLARRMQLMKGVDPALAIYAAYAYRDRRDLQRLDEMHQFLRGDLGASLFDVALLSGALERRRVAPLDGLFGLFPLLTQGWVYLRTQRVTLAVDADALQPFLLDSLWTQFTADGVDRLRSTCFNGVSPWQRVD